VVFFVLEFTVFRR